MKIKIRNAQTSDLPYLYDICLKTGLDGGDASHLYTDSWLVGQHYVAPYVIYDPSTCLVAYDDEAEYKRPLGYIVGAYDTDAFYTWFYNTWAKELQKVYGTKMFAKTPYEQWLIDNLYEQNKFSNKSLFDEYSGHLHIDLLPVLQGQGLGKLLLNEFSKILSEKKATGIHLGVSKNNPNAIGFYKKMGFEEIKSLESVFILGKKL